MKVPLEKNIEAVCSVTELTKKLGLSRARFYQLQKAGVFPMPVYCIHTRRPFYTLELQQKCFEIRKTRIGLNGQPIIFYAPRKNGITKAQNRSDHKIQEMTGILKNMIPDVTCEMVKEAVEKLYPEGLEDKTTERTVITNLSGYINTTTPF